MKKAVLKGLPVALLLAVIIPVSSCASMGSSRGDDGVPKTLIITGIEGYQGDILVTVSSSSSPASSMVAVGGASVSGGTLTIPLVLPGKEDTRWTGTGNYYCVLVFENDNNAIYFYSDGGMSALRYSFTEATTSFPLSKFRRLER